MTRQPPNYFSPACTFFGSFARTRSYDCLIKRFNSATGIASSFSSATQK